MQHLWNLVIKYLLVAAVITAVLHFLGDATVPQRLLTALVLTLVAYAVGDLWVLPAAGNTVATLTDFVLAAVVVWGMQFLLTGMVLRPVDAVVAAAAVAVGEYFFHRYLRAAAAPEQPGPAERPA